MCFLKPGCSSSWILQVEYQTASGQMLDLITTPAGEVDLSKYVLPTYVIWTHELDTWYIWSVVTISSYLSYFSYEHSWMQLQKSPIMFNALESALCFVYILLQEWSPVFSNLQLLWSQVPPDCQVQDCILFILPSSKFVNLKYAQTYYSLIRVSVCRITCRSICENIQDLSKVTLCYMRKVLEILCIFAWNFQMSEVLFESIFQNFEWVVLLLGAWFYQVGFLICWHIFVKVACALLLAGEKDEDKFEAAKEILVQMGTYFQVQVLLKYPFLVKIPLLLRPCCTPCPKGKGMSAGWTT